jgi:hypothetical protein
VTRNPDFTDAAHIDSRAIDGNGFSSVEAGSLTCEKPASISSRACHPGEIGLGFLFQSQSFA